MTGLKIINEGGRAEVRAAHIRPASDRGPDSARNGVALSATVHWTFNRGLVTVGSPPDYLIVFASSHLPEGALRLFRPEGRLALPRDQRTWPAPGYLDCHRSQIFKSRQRSADRIGCPLPPCPALSLPPQARNAPCSRT